MLLSATETTRSTGLSLFAGCETALIGTRVQGRWQSHPHLPALDFLPRIKVEEGWGGGDLSHWIPGPRGAELLSLLDSLGMMTGHLPPLGVGTLETWPRKAG